MGNLREQTLRINPRLETLRQSNVKFLQRGWCQAILDSKFPLDNIDGVERGDCIGNRRSLIELWLSLDMTVHRRLTATAKHEKQPSIDGRNPNVILYGGQATSERAPGWPHLFFKNVWKSDMRAIDMNIKRHKDPLKTRTIYTEGWKRNGGLPPAWSVLEGK